jgi:hypothetical protein
MEIQINFLLLILSIDDFEVIDSKPPSFYRDQPDELA